ncbi:MAG: ferritin family protein [Desulfobacteraceae bacterium]|nr:ferritin family protein [Desulfobacteraceae bacterium]
MANEFNANDIFEMAIKIEKNGAIFYRDAANQVKVEKYKKFLLELAEMEDSHKETFATMKKELSDDETLPTTFDPNDENILYLKALADTQVFFNKEQPDASFKGILCTAIQAEKDSIAFYLGMKELVPAKFGQSRIGDIIKEEMGHIKLLAGKLTEYY